MALSPLLKNLPRYNDAWKLLGDICDAVASAKRQPGEPQILVRFSVDASARGVGFDLSVGGLEQRLHLSCMHLFEPRPAEMPELLWDVFQGDIHRMRDLAELLEQGVARADLARALELRQLGKELQGAQAGIACRHMAPLECIRIETD